MARISVFRPGTTRNVCVACGSVDIRSQCGAFLGLEYRFPLFGSIGNLYGFSLYSITYFTGILGQFIFHFEIVLMSLEFSTNVASTFTRNALMSMLLQRL